MIGVGLYSPVDVISCYYESRVRAHATKNKTTVIQFYLSIISLRGGKVKVDLNTDVKKKAYLSRRILYCRRPLYMFLSLVVYILHCYCYTMQLIG